MKFFKKHLGNGFWETEDDRIFSVKLQAFINKDDLPPTMKYDRSVGMYEVYNGNSFNDMKEGHKFVLFEFCELAKRHKKTTDVLFTRFQTIDMTYRRYPSEVRRDNLKGGYVFEFNFKEGNPYILFCQINYDFPSNIKIIGAKLIKKNEN